MRISLLCGTIVSLFAGIASAQCTKPVISGTTAVSDATGQQLTVTWTTQVPSDSIVGYGEPNITTLTPVSDTSGVTNHTVMISGLKPGRHYQWGVRSQAINGGVGCGTGYIAYDSSDELAHNITMTGPPAGSFTYGMGIIGGSYVTQGYGIYLKMDLWSLTGTYSTTGLQIAVSGLPPNSTTNWSGANNLGGIFPVENDTQSNGAGVNYDTVQVNRWNWYPQELFIQSSPSTPVGNYTLTFTASAINGSGYPSVQTTASLNVVSLSAPFNGVVLSAGYPTAYPDIPDLALFMQSASTYGQQSCAQDFHPLPPVNGVIDTTPRTIRPNDPAHLVTVATCCTYDSWFYDGEAVYGNVQKLLQYTNYTGQNWPQCQSNVQQVYRDNYVLAGGIGTGTVFMGFSKGMYQHYLATQDPNDLAAINYFNAHANSIPYHASMVDVSNLQRETAYSMRNLMHGVALGQTNGGFGNLSAAQMRDYAKEHVLGQIDQLCLSQTAGYFENFMAGLQAMELIDYYNLVQQDPRIPPAIACLATWLHNTQWQKTDVGSFPYDKYQGAIGWSVANGSTSCLNTLNNMISPMYAWLFQYTGDPKWQQWGDAIFDHGVLFDCAPLPTGPASYLTMRFNSDGKAYSQQYEWGANYVWWRWPKNCTN